MLNMTRFALVALLGLVLLTPMGGCKNNKNPETITARDVRGDMSPELQSIAFSREQRRNRVARTVDTNLRQTWDDIDRVLLLDRPLHLSRYPIP